MFIRKYQNLKEFLEIEGYWVVQNIKFSEFTTICYFSNDWINFNFFYNYNYDDYNSKEREKNLCKYLVGRLLLLFYYWLFPFLLLQLNVLGLVKINTTLKFNTHSIPTLAKNRYGYFLPIFVSIRFFLNSNRA